MAKRSDTTTDPSSLEGLVGAVCGVFQAAATHVFTADVAIDGSELLLRAIAFSRLSSLRTSAARVIISTPGRPTSKFAPFLMLDDTVVGYLHPLTATTRRPPFDPSGYLQAQLGVGLAL